MLVRVEQTSVLPIPFETEHAGKSGEQPSVVVEMETYGDQPAAVINHFCYK